MTDSRRAYPFPDKQAKRNVVGGIWIVLAVVVLAGCASRYSGLSVPPQSRFELGGSQSGAFTAALENVGPVAVTVIERARGGAETVRGTVVPGASARLRFAPGSAALVVNAADREAQVDVNLTGDTNLSMGYVAAEAAADAE